MSICKCNDMCLGDRRLSFQCFHLPRSWRAGRGKESLLADWDGRRSRWESETCTRLEPCGEWNILCTVWAYYMRWTIDLPSQNEFMVHFEDRKYKFSIIHVYFLAVGTGSGQVSRKETGRRTQFFEWRSSLVYCEFFSRISRCIQNSVLWYWLGYCFNN